VRTVELSKSEGKEVAEEEEEEEDA